MSARQPKKGPRPASVDAAIEAAVPEYERLCGLAAAGDLGKVFRRVDKMDEGALKGMIFGLVADRSRREQEAGS